MSKKPFLWANALVEISSFLRPVSPFSPTIQETFFLFLNHRSSFSSPLFLSQWSFPFWRFWSTSTLLLFHLIFPSSPGLPYTRFPFLVQFHLHWTPPSPNLSPCPVISGVDFPFHKIFQSHAALLCAPFCRPSIFINLPRQCTLSFSSENSFPFFLNSSFSHLSPLSFVPPRSASSAILSVPFAWSFFLEVPFLVFFFPICCFACLLCPNEFPLFSAHALREHVFSPKICTFPAPACRLSSLFPLEFIFIPYFTLSLALLCSRFAFFPAVAGFLRQKDFPRFLCFGVFWSLPPSPSSRLKFFFSGDYLF